MALIQKAFSDIITFSRSSNATRVGPTGLVEYAPHNLILQSQTFDNAYWTKTNATVTANSTAAPDGTVTADTFVEDSATTIKQINRLSITVSSGVLHTVSVYAKNAGRRYFSVYPQGPGATNTAYAIFDLQNGVIGTTGGGQYSSSSITSIGNGWYRCSVTLTTNDPTQHVAFYLSNASNAPAPSYAGDGTSGIYLWGAQLSVGPYPLDYTPTTSAAVYGPRFDYDPVTLAARGLLVEEQRTNSLQQSENFNAAFYTITAATLTSNAATAPNGVVAAQKLIPSASTANNHRVYSNVASIQTATHSVLIKPDGYSRVALRESSASGAAIGFDLSNQTIITTYSTAGCTASNGTIQSVGNGWYRISATFSFASATNQAWGLYVVAPSWTSGDPESVAWTGDGTSGVLLWGAQMESGSFATSYIPTLASTVTRSADVASVNTLSPWYSSTEGTLYSEWDISSISPDRGASVHLTNTAQTDRAIILTSSSSQVRHLVQVAGVFQVVLDKSPSVANVSKDAYAYKAGSYGASVNGTTVLTSTYGSVPAAADQLFLGCASSNNTVLNGWLRRVAYYPRRLTNAEIVALTA